MPKKKKSDAGPPRYELLHLRLLKEDADVLRARAQAHGISLSDEVRVVIRRIIRQIAKETIIGEL